MENTAMPRVLLILPCFNEAGSIAVLLREVRQVLPAFDALVIDDGSLDATARVALAAADDHIKVVQLPANLGIGGAVQTGLRYAARHDYDYCAQMDGDGQHPPAEYIKLLGQARATGADIVIGSRYADIASFRSTALRRCGSRLIARTLYIACRRLHVTDPTSGMRLMGRRAMRYFAEYYPADYPEPISLAWAARENMQIVEVPVAMRERMTGQSSLSSMRRSVSYMLRVIGYVLVAIAQKRRPLPGGL